MNAIESPEIEETSSPRESLAEYRETERILESQEAGLVAEEMAANLERDMETDPIQALNNLVVDVLKFFHDKKSKISDKTVH